LIPLLLAFFMRSLMRDLIHQILVAPFRPEFANFAALQPIKVVLRLVDLLPVAGMPMNQRDVTMIAVSRAPFSKLAPYKKRMG
jgi:predicted dithiol-disulfide oxidoreductase (DUF899 family)